MVRHCTSFLLSKEILVSKCTITITIINIKNKDLHNSMYLFRSFLHAIVLLWTLKLKRWNDFIVFILHQIRKIVAIDLKAVGKVCWKYNNAFYIHLNENPICWKCNIAAAAHHVLQLLNIQYVHLPTPTRRHRHSNNSNCVLIR